jgi:hypothetical protein
LPNPIPLARRYVKDEQRMFAFQPSINAKVDWLKGVIVSVANQFVYLEQSYLSIWRILGEVENGTDSRIGLDVLPRVPLGQRVSVKLSRLHL